MLNSVFKELTTWANHLVVVEVKKEREGLFMSQRSTKCLDNIVHLCFHTSPGSINENFKLIQELTSRKGLDDASIKI